MLMKNCQFFKYFYIKVQRQEKKRDKAQGREMMTEESWKNHNDAARGEKDDNKKIDDEKRKILLKQKAITTG